MNYKLHYENLIKKSKDRKLSGYVERHHIIPKCMSGSDNETNIAILTPEEHFVAHQLLVKMYPDNKKLLNGLSRMCSGSYKNVRNNKRYGWIRKEWAKSRQGTGNPRAKLSAEQVIEIYYSTESYTSLSEGFNVGTYQIISIKRKLTYKNILNGIIDMPGFYTEGKTTRLPLPIDFIEKIFYDTGDYDYFWKTYNATERVVQGIKNKKSFKRITLNLGKPGQVKRYGMTRDMVDEVYNASGTNKYIAAKFNIHYNTVRNIKGKNSRAFNMWEEF
jgi:hypothetical protein